MSPKGPFSNTHSHTSETTGWGKIHLAISGVSHQPYVETEHHLYAFGVFGYGTQIGGTDIVRSGMAPNPLYQENITPPLE